MMDIVTLYRPVGPEELELIRCRSSDRSLDQAFPDRRELSAFPCPVTQQIGTTRSSKAGWITSAVWALLAGSGQAVLLRAFFRRRGLERRQIAAVTGSSGWGLLCMSGYGFAALRLPAHPWPLLLLPAYPLILVYGILRYRVLVANAWARRAVAWTLLTGCALLVMATLPLPGPTGRAASGVLVVLCCLTLAGPARRLAERLVYPGGTVSPEDFSLWRRALDSAVSPDGLAQCASALLSSRLRLAVGVAVGAGAPQKPGLACCRTDGNRGALALPNAASVDSDLLRFASGEGESAGAPDAGAAGMLDAAIAELETRMLRETMAATGGNQSEAARRLGLSRMGVIKKLSRLGLRDVARESHEHESPS